MLNISSLKLRTPFRRRPQIAAVRHVLDCFSDTTDGITLSSILSRATIGKRYIPEIVNVFLGLGLIESTGNNAYKWRYDKMS